MQRASGAVVALVAVLALGGHALAQAPRFGPAEFGLSHKELARSVEQVELGIGACMRDQGFEYVSVDYSTVRRGMGAIMSLPGLSEAKFIEKHGFGIATLYTGQPPQLVEGYSPARVGLGKKNVEIFRGLSTEDQVAYNRTLFGGNADATFAIGLDTEDFSRCGGCTRQAIEQVFPPDHLELSYYNPKDVMVDENPRMQAALREYAHEMRKAGYAYDHPEEVEKDIRERLQAITRGETIPVERLSVRQREALAELQDYERRVSVVNYRLEELILDEVESQVEDELFARTVQ